jgi:L-cysteine S-thiosulfotransferase
MAFRSSQKGVAEAGCELRKVGTSTVISTATGFLAALLLAPACSASAEELRPYVVSGDSIMESLTGSPGDPVRGRALVVDRGNTCILCHSGPFPEEKFQGDLAPNLAGSGSRWSVGQLRLRLVDASRLNPGTIMPSYYRLDGLERVAANWRGKPILSAEQIEDIVAYLATLHE